MNNMNEILRELQSLGGPLEVSLRTLEFQIPSWKSASEDGHLNASAILDLLYIARGILGTRAIWNDLNSGVNK
jgi:hypothetical protein